MTDLGSAQYIQIIREGDIAIVEHNGGRGFLHTDKSRNCYLSYIRENQEIRMAIINLNKLEKIVREAHEFNQ